MKYLVVLFVLLNAYGFNIKVSVDNLRNSKGVVEFFLYNNKNSIPDKNLNKYIKKQTAIIKNNSANIIFKNIPKGKYAISAIHDENKNGKIDKGFMLPKEGIGFTNYKKINLFNKPNFQNASFELNKNETKKIKIIYF